MTGKRIFKLMQNLDWRLRDDFQHKMDLRLAFYHDWLVALYAEKAPPLDLVRKMKERHAKTGRGKSLLREEANLKLWIFNHDLDLEATLPRQYGHGCGVP